MNLFRTGDTVINIDNVVDIRLDALDHSTDERYVRIVTTATTSTQHGSPIPATIKLYGEEAEEFRAWVKKHCDAVRLVDDERPEAAEGRTDG